MLNFSIAEILTDEKPNSYWKMLKEIGIKNIVGTLPRGRKDWRQSEEFKPWEYVPLARYRNMVKDSGFNLVAIEDNPPMSRIIFSQDGREEDIEKVTKLIENMGKLGIGLWCYSWMGGVGWTRTFTHRITEYGIASGFRSEDVKDAEPYPVRTTHSDLWKSLKWFLDRIIPVATENNVRLAMHPDDPPVDEFLGIPRIMNSPESYDRLLRINTSEYNGITLCQGNFTLMSENLPEVIRHFGKKIFFVHFRDVLGSKEEFIEVPLGRGKTDLVKCMEAYSDTDFDGIMRVDHVPTLSGDDTDVPGYSYLNRLYAIGYINGLRDSVSKPHEEGI